MYFQEEKRLLLIFGMPFIVRQTFTSEMLRSENLSLESMTHTYKILQIQGLSATLAYKHTSPAYFML